MRSTAIATLLLLVFAATAAAEIRTFERPRIGGMRLDWCLTWARACGKPAADAFCERRGYVGALNFAMEPNVGATEPTRLITGAVCDADMCNGFTHVSCAR
ncbi:hypothetical protein EYW49_11675 [Siculibacillus lacustris]|uniref:Uncharacterized protein n=1 Tax=Siculibacillus lacustris TaxID=1549641 RepID=A0A4Q9VNZ9_9HYPH|nr:hypothetical protein [Siculibacillus lacustris]TBW37408.1 hypothetical protein EYW49_11675 [Siculibacillus lacustris]